MKLGYTILYVHDVPKTLAFYQAAFGFQPRFLHEGGDWGELETGTTCLSFCSYSLLKQIGKTTQTPDPKTPCFEIALVTENVATAMQHALDAGAVMIQEPEQMPWGQTVAYVADINGFLVELCTPMTPS